MVLLALFAYATAMVVANLLVAFFGPSIMPLLAFVLIGLDLALRDWLHVRVQPWRMGVLILGTSVLTLILNPAAQQIAVASAVSFCVAAMADWMTFAKVSGSWFRRSASSNVTGAAVDSVIFPTLAFGVLMPQIVLAQFAAKVLGGTLWTWLLSRRRSALGDGKP
jgi:queuosine precursor transporter